jgi:hypothetical protein
VPDSLQGLASSDHTTLLLNCYAKLRDTAKLDRFLRAEGPDGQPALSFDVDTAIKARLFTGPPAVVSQMSSVMQAYQLHEGRATPAPIT